MTAQPVFPARYCLRILLAFLFFCGHTLNAQSNLLTNPGFELGNTSGWTTWGSTLTASTAQVRSGSYSGLVTNRTADWQTAVINALPLVTTGKTYQFSVWVRLAPGASSSVSAVIAQTDGNPRSYTALQTVTANSSGWAQITGIFTYMPTGTATELSIYFACADATRNLYLDDASLVETTNLLEAIS